MMPREATADSLVCASDNVVDVSSAAALADKSQQACRDRPEVVGLAEDLRRQHHQNEEFMRDLSAWREAIDSSIVSTPQSISIACLRDSPSARSATMTQSYF